MSILVSTALTSSGPRFRVHRKVETLVPSAMIDTCYHKAIIGIQFSQYISCLLSPDTDLDEEEHQQARYEV